MTTDQLNEIEEVISAEFKKFKEYFELNIRNSVVDISSDITDFKLFITKAGLTEKNYAYPTDIIMKLDQNAKANNREKTLLAYVSYNADPNDDKDLIIADVMNETLKEKCSKFNSMRKSKNKKTNNRKYHLKLTRLFHDFKWIFILECTVFLDNF